MFHSRWIRKISALPHGKGQRRRQAAQTRRPVRLLLEALEDRLAPADATMTVPGNATINFNGTGSSPAFTIPVAVNDITTPTTTVNSGNVSIGLVSGSTTAPLGTTGTVTNGTASLTVNQGNTALNGLLAGNYELVESYSGAAGLNVSNAFGTLTVVASPTSVVAGDATVNYYGPAVPSASPAFTITAAVNAPNGGAVTTGSVSIYLDTDNTILPSFLGKADVGANGVPGTATISVAGGALPSGLQTGNYQLIEKYTDVGGGKFDPSTGSGTLTIAQAPTTVVPGNATINFYDNTPSPLFSITAAVNSTTGGTVNTGAVTFSLNSGANNPPTSLGGPVNVGANGVATIQVAANTLPANLQTGNYQLIETYTDKANGQFASSTGTGTLTINQAPTSVVAGSPTVNAGNNLPFTVTVGVNSPAGTVDPTGTPPGSVTINLVSDNTITNLTPIPLNVTNGTASGNIADNTALTVISQLAPGSYQLIETYKDAANGQFAGSSGSGTLTVKALATTIVPGGASINVGSVANFSIPVAVNSPAGTVNSGNVTISLVNGNNPPITLGTAPVSNGATTPAGTANVPVTGVLLSDLQNGKYQLLETYNDSTNGVAGPFANSNAFGTLTVNPTPIPATTVIPANVTVSTNDGTKTLSVVVNSPSGPVNTGTVTISLINGGTVTTIGSASVLGGSAHVTVNIPTLSAGSYQLEETYVDGTGHFGGSSAIGTLTAEPIPPGTAALELAIDAAALALRGNIGAQAELSLFANVFLHFTIPSDLVGNIQTLYPKTGELGLLAIGAGMALAQDLQQENPSK